VYGILRPARASMADPSAPFTSPATLVAVYLDGAAWLAEHLMLAALAAAVFLERRRRAVIALTGAWALSAIVLAAAYPSPAVRGPGLARVYLAVELVSVALAVACIIAFAGRRLSPRAPQGIVLFLLATEIAALAAGPWRSWIFQGWDAERVMLLVSYLFIAFIQGVLWRFSAGSARS
jgi:hypothetical protein